jgi:4a-hydroxytetrahydrobiopterin dehydratase
MAAPLSDDQITEALRELSGWSYKDNRITRSFQFGSFKEALSFLVRVGMHAEEAHHHPEIHNVYDRVTLSLSTHDAGGRVTRKDLDLARTIQGFEWTGATGR